MVKHQACSCQNDPPHFLLQQRYNLPVAVASEVVVDMAAGVDAGEEQNKAKS